MAKTTEISEYDDNEKRYIGRSVTVYKTFKLYDTTFYVVKNSKHTYRAIEAITGAPIAHPADTVKEAYQLAMMKLTSHQAELKLAIDKWLQEIGPVDSLAPTITYLKR